MLSRTLIVGAALESGAQLRRNGVRLDDPRRDDRLAIANGSPDVIAPLTGLLLGSIRGITGRKKERRIFLRGRERGAASKSDRPRARAENAGARSERDETAARKRPHTRIAKPRATPARSCIHMHIRGAGANLHSNCRAIRQTRHYGSVWNRAAGITARGLLRCGTRC